MHKEKLRNSNTPSIEELILNFKNKYITNTHYLFTLFSCLSPLLIVSLTPLIANLRPGH